MVALRQLGAAKLGILVLLILVALAGRPSSCFVTFKRFKRTTNTWAFRTLEKRREHTLTLFATKWDGYADRMAKGVEDAINGLVRSMKEGQGYPHLANLTLLRLDTTFEDLPKLRQKYGLQMELPAFFYFRNGAAHTFSHRDTVEAYKTTLVKIGRMGDVDVPLEHLRSRQELEDTVAGNEITFVFVDSPLGVGEGAKGGEEEDAGECDAGKDAKARLRQALAENPDAEGMREYLEEFLETADFEAEGLEEELANLQTFLRGSKHSKDAAKDASWDEIEKTFLDVAKQNLLSQIVRFCYANSTEVLPADIVTQALLTSKGGDGSSSDGDEPFSGGFSIFAFRGRDVIDVFTPSCSCDLLSWLRSFLTSHGSVVSTLTDMQFWTHLSEQVEAQTTWALAQERRMKLKNREIITKKQRKDPEEAMDEEELLGNDYEVLVLLLQSDQVSERQSKEGRDYRSFVEAAGEVLGLAPREALRVCARGAGPHECEALDDSGAAALSSAADEDRGNVTEELEAEAIEAAESTEGEELELEEEEEEGTRVYKFIHVPYTQEIWRGSLPAMLELADFPRVMLFDTRNKLYYDLQRKGGRRHAQGFTAEEIVDFVSDHKNNALKPFLRSEVIVEDQSTVERMERTSRPINVDSFGELNFPRSCTAGEVVSVVLFHTAWCSFCKRAMGIFKELAEEAGKEDYAGLNHIKFYTLDCDRNDCYPSVLGLGKAGEHLDKLPQFLVFPCGRPPVQYNGYRSVDILLTRLVELNQS